MNIHRDGDKEREQRGMVIPRHFLDSSFLDDQGEPRVRDQLDVMNSDKTDPMGWPELSLDLVEELLWLDVLV